MVERLEYFHGSEGYSLRPDKGGRYMFYSDHETALAAENSKVERLREALQNMMGVYDTPLSRRRFPPDDFMTEALVIARAALKETEHG